MRTVTLGPAPDALVLDLGSGRAAVGSASAETVSLLDLAPLRVNCTMRVGAPGPLAPLSMAFDSQTHRLFVTNRGDAGRPGPVQTVQMLDSRTGTHLASVRVGHEASALAVDVVHECVVVANEADGTVSLLDARSGALLRTTATALLPTALVVDARTARAFVIGPAGSADLGLSTLAVYLAVLDTRSGALLRRMAVGTGVDALALDERHARLIVASSAGTLSILDAHDGTLLRTVTLGGTSSALAVDERRGRVFVVDALEGTLRILDGASGALLGTVHVADSPNAAYPTPEALAVDEARDRVYLTTWGPLVPVQGQGLTPAGAGTLLVLDARTGQVRRRIAVGVAPQAVAVDAGSGRVVVANAGGEALPAADWAAPWIDRLRQWLPWLGRGAPRQPTTERVPGSVSLIDGAA